MDNFAELLVAERAWLVRLCGHLSDNLEAAEDLAHETLIEAWRQQARLVNSSGLRQWLAAIARFVCLRWRRKQSREPYWHGLSSNQTTFDDTPEIGDSIDVAAEFDRHELLALLDRAVALLPVATRTLLIQAYVEDCSHSEIAASLNISEGAVAMRLQRGKQALKRILITDLKTEAAAWGLVELDATHSHTLRIWCPFCGVDKIQYVREANGRMLFRCLRCIASGFAPQIVSVPFLPSIRTLKNLKTVLGHSLARCNDYYRSALATRQTLCLQCHATLPVGLRLQDDVGVHIFCTTCNELDTTTLPYLVLDLPETRAFWRDHTHMRTIPTRSITFANEPALLTTFESVDGAAWINVVSAVNTLEVRLIERSAVKEQQ